MREYRIRITGEYDVLVVSPRMIERLITRIRQSDSRELVIPAEEILPPGYTDYLSRVLEANGEQDGEKSGQNVYDVLAGQIVDLDVRVLLTGEGPQSLHGAVGDQGLGAVDEDDRRERDAVPLDIVHGCS